MVTQLSTQNDRPFDMRSYFTCDDVQLHIHISCTSMSKRSTFLDFLSSLLICFKHALSSTAFTNRFLKWKLHQESVYCHSFVNSNWLVPGYLHFLLHYNRIKKSALRMNVNERGLWDFKTEMLPLMGRYLSPIIVLMAKGHLDAN